MESLAAAVLQVKYLVVDLSPILRENLKMKYTPKFVPTIIGELNHFSTIFICLFSDVITSKAFQFISLLYQTGSSACSLIRNSKSKEILVILD